MEELPSATLSPPPEVPPAAPALSPAAVASHLSALASTAPASVAPVLASLSKYAAGDWPEEGELSSLSAAATVVVAAVQDADLLVAESLDRMREVGEQREAASAAFASLAAATDLRLSASDTHNRIERLELLVERLTLQLAQAERAGAGDGGAVGELTRRVARLEGDNAALKQRLVDLRYAPPNILSDPPGGPSSVAAAATAREAARPSASAAGASAALAKPPSEAAAATLRNRGGSKEEGAKEEKASPLPNR